jgi:hypothetical protein
MAVKCLLTPPNPDCERRLLFNYRAATTILQLAAASPERPAARRCTVECPAVPCCSCLAVLLFTCGVRVRGRAQ